jgi:triacylglycerol lipase
VSTRPTRDVTDRFRRLYAAAAAGKGCLPASARQHPVLLVGGLFAALFPGYLAANLRHLRRLGVDAVRVPVAPQGRVEENAETVLASLRTRATPDRPAVLFAHSKGGVDAAAALSLHPEARALVRALVAVQTPFRGSRLAGDIAASPRTMAAADRLLRGILGGRAEAIADITPASRLAFLRRHPWRGDVPTVSVATATRSPLSPLAAAAAWIRRRYGAASDGLVLADEAVVPGSWVVRLDDADHATPVFAGLPGLASYRPGPLTEALVALALALEMSCDHLRNRR